MTLFSTGRPTPQGWGTEFHSVGSSLRARQSCTPARPRAPEGGNGNADVAARLPPRLFGFSLCEPRGDDATEKEDDPATEEHNARNRHHANGLRSESAISGQPKASAMQKGEDARYESGYDRKQPYCAKSQQQRLRGANMNAVRADGTPFKSGRPNSTRPSGAFRLARITHAQPVRPVRSPPPPPRETHRLPSDPACTPVRPARPHPAPPAAIEPASDRPPAAA